MVKMIIRSIAITIFVFAACEKDRPTSPNTHYCNIITPGMGDTLLIGEINISVEAESYDSIGYIQSVVFYIDDNIVFTDAESPYYYSDTTVWHRAGNCNIKAVARNNEGLIAESEIFVHLLLFEPVNSSPDTIYVPGDYSLIQDAINNSQDGDFILIADGNYGEDLTIDHPLYLIGNGENTILVDNSINVESDYVVLKDFMTGQSRPNLGGANSAIHIVRSNNVLIENIITTGESGFCAYDPYSGMVWATSGGKGIGVSGSSRIIIQNVESYGGRSPEFECGDSSDGGGHGIGIGGSALIYIVNSSMDGGAGGIGGRSLALYGNSFAGIRNCTLIGREPYIHSSSILIYL
jgi:hypothetical protein